MAVLDNPEPSDIQQIIDMLKANQHETAEPSPLGGRGVTAMILAGLGDAFSAGAGRPARGIDRVQRQRTQNQALRQRTMDKDFEQTNRIGGLMLDQARYTEGKATEEQHYQEGIDAKTAAAIKADKERDEDYRNGLEEEARNNPFFDGDVSLMTNDELKSGLGDAQKKYYEREEGKAGAVARAQHERAEMAEANSVLNAFIDGNPTVGLASLSARLKSGEKPEEIMRKFRRRLGDYQLAPADKLALESEMRAELGRLAASAPVTPIRTPEESADATRRGAAGLFDPGVPRGATGQPDIIGILGRLFGGSSDGDTTQQDFARWKDTLQSGQP